MSAKSEEFRDYAVECERRAAKAGDPSVREQFLNVARQWRKLAEQLDRYNLAPDA